MNTEGMEQEEYDQIIELDGNDAQPESDDEDQQSTSNCSGMDDNEVVDDSVASLQAHDQDCFSIDVSGKRFLASGGEDDCAFLWDHTVSESDPVLKVEHKDSVISVKFNKSGTLLASADMAGKIVITDLRTLKTRLELEDCSDLEWISWHTAADILFAGDKDGTIWMWLISASGIAQSKVFIAGGSPCTVGYVMPDGKRLLAGYADGITRMWVLRDQTSSQISMRSPISSITHHDTLPIGIVGTQSGTVQIINTAQENSIRAFGVIPGLADPTKQDDEEEDVNQCVECISIAPNHPWFAVGRNDGTMCIYELDSSTPRSIFRSPQAQAINSCQWAMDGNTPFLIAGSIDGQIRIFDARDGSVFKDLGNGGDEVLDMLIVDLKPLKFLTACGGGIIRTFDLSMI